MDANELNELLENVRYLLSLLRDATPTTGGAAFLEMLTKVAVENKVAYKSIGHNVEEHLLKVRSDELYQLCRVQAAFSRNACSSCLSRRRTGPTRSERCCS